MSTIIVDTLTGKSTATTITIGSTPVVSASANSMTIRGEGSAQTSIQQGLCKQWAQFEGDGTVAISDSFNCGTLTDNGTGDYTVANSTNFGNALYSVGGLGTHDPGSYNCYLLHDHDAGATQTSAVNLNTLSPASDGTAVDIEHITFNCFGDLA